MSSCIDCTWRTPHLNGKSFRPVFIIKIFHVLLCFIWLEQPSEASETKIQLPGMEEEVSSLK
jgi:hypothetical protein